MVRKGSIRVFAPLLLLLLLAAWTGQKVHIYRENPLHFAAWAGDRMPDNGARHFVSERCIVDDFCLFPYLRSVQPAPRFRSEVLSVLHPEATRCKACAPLPGRLLRAPPLR